MPDILEEEIEDFDEENWGGIEDYDPTTPPNGHTPADWSNLSGSDFWEDVEDTDH